jgi:hypothetical protein
MFIPPYDDGRYKMTFLNFSGGKQSSVLLWMVLNGELKKPDNFAVLTADPGMENSLTYEYVKLMHAKCAEAGIKAVLVDGPNLVTDIMDFDKRRARKRFDNPPYWNAGVDGRIGRLRQYCTAHYKIRPMNRAMRLIMEEMIGIPRKSSRIPEKSVCKWIGFSHDEVMRIKPSGQRYTEFQYPLIDMKMKKEDVLRYFLERGLPIPPRSVCNACFSNGIATYKEMYRNRPKDWEQAVAIDEAVRDMSDVGVRMPCFVSKTCMPLARLAELDFNIDMINAEIQVLGYKLSAKDDDNMSCDSGYCFT